MDYTLSPQHVVHVGTGHRMHEDNQAVPTMVTDADFNSVIWSLMQLLEASGVDPAQFNPADPATYRKVLMAVATLNRRCYGSVAAAGGTADGITATFDPPVIALTDGLHLRVRAATANTATDPTFKVGALDAKVICKGPGLPLDIGDIHGVGHWLSLQFDAVLDMWVLLNPAHGISAVPTGMVMPFLATSPPAGWLKANGSIPSIASIPRLASIIYCGDSNNATAEWGYRCTNPASASTTRNVAGTHIVLPDMRAEFLRGWDDSRGVDSGRSFWASQKGSLLMGNEAYDSQVMGFASVAADRVGLGWDPLSSTAGYSATVSHTSTGVVQSPTLYSVEHFGVARSRNVPVLFCIKG